MPKFPAEVEESIVVAAARERAYAYLWDVARSSACIPALASCEPLGDATYCFTSKPRSAGPVSLAARYTARYEGHEPDRIRFVSIDAAGDNTDVDGTLLFEDAGAEGTRITLRQMIAPDTPVPRLLQGVIRSFVEREAAGAVREFLHNVKRALEGSA